MRACDPAVAFATVAAHQPSPRHYLTVLAEAQRGQGLARALMARLLADDIARGARWSVLTASRMGERLYAGLGYRTLGAILIFEPHQERVVNVHPIR